MVVIHLADLRRRNNGDVTGPASAADGDVAGFDGTTGKIVKTLDRINLGSPVAAVQYRLHARNLRAYGDGVTADVAAAVWSDTYWPTISLTRYGGTYAAPTHLPDGAEVGGVYPATPDTGGTLRTDGYLIWRRDGAATGSTAPLLLACVANGSDAWRVRSSGAVELPGLTASRLVTTDASKALATTLTLDTDGTLSANSDTNVPTQKATKTYVDALIDQVLKTTGTPQFARLGLGMAPDATSLLTAQASSIGAVPLFDMIDDGTTSVVSALRMAHTTTVDMTDGFGTGATFYVRDNANVLNPIGTAGFRRNGADNTGEFVAYNFIGGSSTEVFCAGPDGTFRVVHASAPRYRLKLSDISVSAGQTIGTVDWETADTSIVTNSIAASQRCEAMSVISSDINPGRLVWATTPSSVGAALVDRMQLDETGLTLYDTVPFSAFTANYGFNPKRLYFDGTGDYVALGSTGQITELSGVANFTISVWMYATSIAATRFLFMNSVEVIRSLRFSLTSTNRLQFAVNNGSEAYGYVTGYSTLFGLNRWNHVMVAYDGAGVANADRLKIYVNGVQQTLTFSGTIPATTADLSSAIAYISSTGTSSWLGYLERFSVHNSTLSVTDAETLARGINVTTDQVHYWDMGFQPGTSLTDGGTNPVTGTVSGASWVDSNCLALGNAFPLSRLHFAADTTREGGIGFTDAWLYRSGVAALTLLGALQTGGISNYTSWDTTGHQSMAGSAKPWNDVRCEPVARTTDTNAPTFEKWLDDLAGSSRGVYLYSFDDAAAGSEKEIFFSLQMPHDWDGGPVHLHVHWMGNKADTTATPRWGLEFAWMEPGATYGDTTTIYAVGNEQGNVDIAAYKHYITEFAAQTPTSSQDGLSSILVGRLFRNSSDAADTYNVADNKCGLLYIDAHYQMARLGSTDEYTA